MSESKKPLYKRLYFQVIVSIIFAIIFGVAQPEFAQKVKPFGDGFMKLIKMMVAPIIFTSVVVGIAKVGNLKKLGRLGLKSIIYFEVVSTIALLIGFFMTSILQPGAKFNIQPAGTENTQIVANISEKGLGENFFLDLIPNTMFSPFVDGNILQVLLIAILFGIALANFNEKGKGLINIIDQSSHTMFGIINIVMKFAPIGVFGAMAYSIGKYGFATLIKLGSFLLCFYISNIIFIVLVLGGICVFMNISLWRLIIYIKEELFIVLATSSSEAALPRLIVKMENLGCSNSVTGLVIPTGYSFNLDGTSIYLTAALLFLAQATNVDLTIAQQFTIIGLLFLTSKGAAAVPGGGFIVLVSTLASINIIPISAAAVLLGIDRFMSDGRSITNYIGNAVATIAVAKWENEFDEKQADRVLRHETIMEADNPEVVSNVKVQEYKF